jgi:phosphomannomutase
MDGAMKHLSCFKAYDVRGKLGSELTEEIAYRIGRSFGQFVYEDATTRVVVGCDPRLSSESLKQATTNGLRDAGVSVLDIGLTGTEEIYFATKYLGVAGGVEITASHNPIDYNGIKFVLADSKPITRSNGLDEVQRVAEAHNFLPVSSELRGGFHKISTLSEYVDHLLSYIAMDELKPLKLVVNAGNGAAGHVVDAIEERFTQRDVPVEFIKIHHEPDGTFPNGIPNPLLPERRKDTADAVIAHTADLGIAWDGDFDRCFFFDHTGQFIEGYYLVGMLAEAFLQKESGGKIIHDPRLTWNTVEVVQAAGGIPVQSKTGHAFIKERMREEDAVYGGEMSAHHYFRDFAYCDSGMIPWLLVIGLLSQKGKSLKQEVEDRIQAYPSSGEINLKLENPAEAIEHVRLTYDQVARDFDATDGVSMEFDAWRFNLRSSNTEPVVRLNVESKGNELLMQQKTAELLSLLQSVH